MEGGKERVNEDCSVEDVMRGIPGSLYSVNLHGNRVQLKLFF